MSKLADCTVGIAVVLAHFVIMTLHEWRLTIPPGDGRQLPPRS